MNTEEALLEKGGAFEIIGLDAHTADTQHPCNKKVSPTNDFFKINDNLTKRQLSLKKLSTVLGWGYRAEPSY